MSDSMIIQTKFAVLEILLLSVELWDHEPDFLWHLMSDGAVPSTSFFVWCSCNQNYEKWRYM